MFHILQPVCFISYSQYVSYPTLFVQFSNFIHFPFPIFTPKPLDHLENVFLLLGNKHFLEACFLPGKNRRGQPAPDRAI